MTIYCGGTVEGDHYRYVEFVDMQSVHVLFNDRPSFSNMVTCTWIEVMMTYVQVGSSEEQKDF